MPYNFFSSSNSTIIKKRVYCLRCVKRQSNKFNFYRIVLTNTRLNIYSAKIPNLLNGKFSVRRIHTERVNGIAIVSLLFSLFSNRKKTSTRRRYCFVELDCYVSMALQRHGIEKRVKRSLPQLRDFFSVLDDGRPVPVCGQSDYTDGLCRFFFVEVALRFTNAWRNTRMV